MNSSMRPYKEEVRSLEKQVRQILLAWNPIGVPVPDDEYDCVVHKVLSSWLRGQSKEQLRAAILREK